MDTNLTKEYIQSLYFDEQLSIRQIASHLGVGKSTIIRTLQESPLRSKAEAAKLRYEPLYLAGNHEELAYLVGIYLGDGCLIQSSRTELLDIACDTKYKGLMERFANLVSRVFGKSPAVVCLKRMVMCTTVVDETRALWLDFPILMKHCLTKSSNSYTIWDM